MRRRWPRTFVPNWRSNFWAVSWSTGGIITPAFAINTFNLVSFLEDENRSENDTSHRGRLGDALEEFLGGFLGGIQVAQVELEKDGLPPCLLLKFVQGTSSLGL